MQVNLKKNESYNPNFKARVSADLTEKLIGYCGKNVKKGMKANQKIQDIAKWASVETELGFKHDVYHYKKFLSKKPGSIDSFQITISNPEVKELNRVSTRRLPIKEKSSMRQLFNAFMKLDETAVVEQEKNLFTLFRF